MYIPPLSDIRAMARGTAELERKIEQACLNAMLLRAQEDERAELLYIYARSIAKVDEQRKDDAADYAIEAYKLALKATHYVLAARARCLSLYCMARQSTINRGLAIGQFWQDFSVIQRELMDWTTTLGLPAEQVRQIEGFLKKLQGYGDSLAAARGVSVDA